MPHVTTALDFEPSLTHVFLPGCRNCGAKHPMAHKPPLDSDTCPECGAPVAQAAAPVEVPALVHDPLLRLGSGFLAAGRKLFALAKRI